MIDRISVTEAMEIRAALSTSCEQPGFTICFTCTRHPPGQNHSFSCGHHICQFVPPPDATSVKTGIILKSETSKEYTNLPSPDMHTMPESCQCNHFLLLIKSMWSNWSQDLQTELDLGFCINPPSARCLHSELTICYHRQSTWIGEHILTHV